MAVKSRNKRSKVKRLEYKKKKKCKKGANGLETKNGSNKNESWELEMKNDHNEHIIVCLYYLNNLSNQIIKVSSESFCSNYWNNLSEMHQYQ